MKFWFICYCFFTAIKVYCKSEFLTRLTEYLSNDLNVNSVSLILDSPANLSDKAVLIMRKMIGSLPSIVVSGQALNLSQPQDRRYQSIREVLSSRLEHKKLKILIIDVRDKVEIKKLLTDYMNLFSYYPHAYKRSKCLIILVNQAGISFDVSGFFKYAWSLNFLYVTLINVNDTMDKAIPVRIEDSDVTVHQYNPFRNHTYKLPYVKNEKLFVNKLKNLYGFRLNAAFFEDIPLMMLKRNHPTNQLLTDDLYGVDLIVSKTLAEVMNFTIYVKLNGSGSTPNVLFQHLRNNSVDFVLNIMTTAGVSTLTPNKSNSISIHLQQFGHKLILKQQGYYEYKYFPYLVIIMVVSVTAATFSTLMCLLSRNRKSWNVLSIALMILGITSAMNLRRFSERFFYVSLTFISVFVSLKLLNNLLSNMLIERKFRHYETLADVVEADMAIGISKFVKSILTPSPSIDKLFDRSVDINNFEGATGCVESLLTGSKPINGCDVNNVMADLASRSYSDPNGEWTIGSLSGPDPLGTGMTWTTMSFALPSVYPDQCNVILRRLLESGLIPFWRNYDHAQWYFKRSTSNQFKNESFKFKNPRNQARITLEYKTVELNVQMIGILTLGWGMSCLSFLFEIIWHAFKMMRVRKKYCRDHSKIDN